MDDISNLFIIAIVILILVSLWKLFEKAGRKGWEAVIPIYNLFVIQKIIDKPWYWVILMFIPYIGLIWTVWSTNLFAKSFGKDQFYTFALVVVPFIAYPMLAFSDSVYTDPRGSEKPDEVEIV